LLWLGGGVVVVLWQRWKVWKVDCCCVEYFIVSWWHCCGVVVVVSFCCFVVVLWWCRGGVAVVVWWCCGGVVLVLKGTESSFCGAEGLLFCGFVVVVLLF